MGIPGCFKCVRLTGRICGSVRKALILASAPVCFRLDSCLFLLCPCACDFDLLGEVVKHPCESAAVLCFCIARQGEAFGVWAREVSCGGFGCAFSWEALGLEFVCDAA